MVAAGRAARPLCPVAPHPRIRAVVVAAAGGAAAALAAVARGHMLRELDSEDRMRRRCWGYDRAWRGQTEREVATVAAGSVETGAAATRPPGGPHPRRAGRQGRAARAPGRGLASPRPARRRVRRSLVPPATAASHAPARRGGRRSSSTPDATTLRLARRHGRAASLGPPMRVLRVSQLLALRGPAAREARRWFSWASAAASGRGYSLEGDRDVRPSHAYGA